MKRDQLPDEVRERFIAMLREDKTRGDVSTLVQAFRECGDFVYKSEVKHLVDDDLRLEAREARGWTVEPIVQNLHAMAVDPKSPHAIRAATLFLNGPHGEPGWRDQSRLELTGADGGPVEVDDVSAGLERFAALTASAVRAAGRTQASEPDPDA